MINLSIERASDSDIQQIIDSTEKGATMFVAVHSFYLMAKELKVFREASKVPVADVVAWHHPTEERSCDIRWRRFDVAPGPLYAAPQLQAVTVPDEVTFEQAMLEVHGLSPAEAFQKAWNKLRGEMLKSVTNEP